MTKLLDCLPFEKYAQAVQDLGDYQKEHYGEKLKLPKDDYKQVVINAPDYQELEEIEAQKEMSKAPSRSRGKDENN